MTIRELVIQKLAEHPIYREYHQIRINGRTSKVFITYQTGLSSLRRGTHFDLQIQDGTCHLLHISIEEEFRGRGWGLLLYQIIEDITRQIGCWRIKMTCSGKTIHGEARFDWCCRRLGYRPLFEGEREVVCKNLKPEPEKK